MLTLLGTAPLASTVLAPARAGAGPAASGNGVGRVPDGLKPGGELDRLVADLTAKDQFSGTVLLTHRGRTVLDRSYGMADKARSVPNGPGTAFALASVTKLFTAVAIARLVEQRTVAYTDPVGRFLDGFPATIADRVTVHHLLTHTSGLGDHHMAPGFWDQAASWTSPEAVMAGCTAFIRESSPAFEPGAGHRYSNSGYHLLGEIVARASGRSYYDYVREHVFAAAGMDDTDFPTRPQRSADVGIAHPYAKQASGERVDVTDRMMFVGTPAGDAYATAADLDRFGQALLQERLLTPPLTHITLGGKVPMPPPPGANPPPTTFQCYGPIGGYVNGHATLGHGGGSPGASTSLDLYPDTRWSVVVLCNYGDNAALPVARLARRIITT